MPASSRRGYCASSSATSEAGASIRQTTEQIRGAIASIALLKRLGVPEEISASVSSRVAGSGLDASCHRSTLHTSQPVITNRYHVAYS